MVPNTSTSIGHSHHNIGTILCLLLVYRVITIIRRRFPVLKGEQQWWTSYCSSRVSLSFRYRKKNGKRKKVFHIVPFERKTVPLSFDLSHAKQLKWDATSFQSRNQKETSSRGKRDLPQSAWNETQFLIDFLIFWGRKDDWHLSMMGDEAKDINCMQYLLLFRRPPWLYSYRGDKTKVCCF